MGCAVYVVEGLGIHELEWHIGRTEQNSACFQEPAHGDRMCGRLRGLKWRDPPGARLTLDAEALLDVDRYAMQCPCRRLPGHGVICARSRGQRLLSQLIDVGIECRLEGVDTPQCVLRQFDRRHLPSTDSCGRFESCYKVRLKGIAHSC